MRFPFNLTDFIVSLATKIWRRTNIFLGTFESIYSVPMG